jgi:serpin B
VELTGGNTAFAFDLYQALREDDGNPFFSSFSISAALAMVYAGARNETERQMAETLHFSLSQETLHPAFKALDLALNAPDRGQNEYFQPFQLRVANSLWGQSGFESEAEFLDLLATNYGAGLGLVDFVDPTNREEARLAINQWVSDQTEGRIKDIVGRGALNELTRLVLANAIYFKAEWDIEFQDPVDDEFSLLNGQRVAVQMMSNSHSANYVRGEGYQAVELGYRGGDARMIVLLPDQGRFEEIERLLGKDMVEDILRTFARTRVDLFMPRFEFEASLDLADILEAMGMPDAFSGQTADFAGIAAISTPRLYIGQVLHKAFVAVDEMGTEAAAATIVFGEAIASVLIEEPVIVRIDRPFIFVIRDSEHDTILFVGRVLDPTK